MSCRDFYQKQARAYFDQTRRVDPTSFLLPLAEKLSPGAKILDVGCGSGRDMLWLHKQGFSCSGLEQSPALASLARSHTGLPVIESDMEAFDFSKAHVEALLLIGALVHLPYAQFPIVFNRVLRALQPKGLVLLTMKKGRGRETFPDGRIFFLWEKNELTNIFQDNSLVCLDYSEQVSRIREGEVWMSFVLQNQRLLIP